MNCPFCQKRIFGMTGLQEAQAFRKHLPKCRKNPNNVSLSDGKRRVTVADREYHLMDAVKLRSESGQ